MPKDRENVYVCQKCGGHTVTVDIDEGVTPFMIECYAKDGCDGSAYSSFYPAGPRPAHIPAPSHEWYRPIGAEYDALDYSTREQHVDLGGLLLRKRGA